MTIDDVIERQEPTIAFEGEDKHAFADLLESLLPPSDANRINWIREGRRVVGVLHDSQPFWDETPRTFVGDVFGREWLVER